MRRLKSIEQIEQELDECKVQVEVVGDGMSYDESWDLNQGIIVRQDFRDGGAAKFADRLFRVMTAEQWAMFVFNVQDQVRDKLGKFKKEGE